MSTRSGKREAMSGSNTTEAMEGIVQSDGARVEAVTVEKVGEEVVARDEAVFVDLPAPAGWKKKVCLYVAVTISLFF